MLCYLTGEPPTKRDTGGVGLVTVDQEAGAGGSWQEAVGSRQEAGGSRQEQVAGISGQLLIDSSQLLF